MTMEPNSMILLGGAVAVSALLLIVHKRANKRNKKLKGELEVTEGLLQASDAKESVSREAAETMASAMAKGGEEFRMLRNALSAYFNSGKVSLKERNELKTQVLNGLDKACDALGVPRAIWPKNKAKTRKTKAPLSE